MQLFFHICIYCYRDLARKAGIGTQLFLKGFPKPESLCSYPLKTQNLPLIIHAPPTPTIPHRSVQRHNRRHRAVNLLRRLLLARLERLSRYAVCNQPEHHEIKEGNSPVQIQGFEKS